MPHLYEKLMSRMSPTLKPVSSAYTFSLKKLPLKKLDFHPFITISREPGSGGRPIAKRLSKLTGFTYYGKDMLEQVAKDVKKRRQVIEAIDEQGRSGIQDFIQSLFNPDYVSDVSYIRHLCNVMLSLSEQGDVIILGRGANFITSPDKGLHVRISAPYAVRVERAIKFEKLSQKKAKARVKKIDADRRNFIRQYFSRNISNANYYDLILNTTYIPIKQATDLILKAFELKFPGYLKRFKLLKKRPHK